jgi:hypothetical protein
LCIDNLPTSDQARTVPWATPRLRAIIVEADWEVFDQRYRRNRWISLAVTTFRPLNLGTDISRFGTNSIPWKQGLFRFLATFRLQATKLGPINVAQTRPSPRAPAFRRPHPIGPRWLASGTESWAARKPPRIQEAGTSPLGHTAPHGFTPVGAQVWAARKPPEFKKLALRPLVTPPASSGG